MQVCTASWRKTKPVINFPLNSNKSDSRFARNKEYEYFKAVLWTPVLAPRRVKCRRQCIVGNTLLKEGIDKEQGNTLQGFCLAKKGLFILCFNA